MTTTMRWAREGLLIKGDPNSTERLLDITDLARLDVPYGGDLDERSSGYIVSRREWIEQRVMRGAK
jgi:hypothetical protein